MNHCNILRSNPLYVPDEDESDDYCELESPSEISQFTIRINKRAYSFAANSKYIQHISFASDQHVIQQNQKYVSSITGPPKNLQSSGNSRASSPRQDSKPLTYYVSFRLPPSPTLGLLQRPHITEQMPGSEASSHVSSVSGSSNNIYSPPSSTSSASTGSFKLGAAIKTCYGEVTSFNIPLDSLVTDSVLALLDPKNCGKEAMPSSMHTIDKEALQKIHPGDLEAFSRSFAAGEKPENKPFQVLQWWYVMKEFLFGKRRRSNYTPLDKDRFRPHPFHHTPIHKDQSTLLRRISSSGTSRSYKRMQEACHSQGMPYFGQDTVSVDNDVKRVMMMKIAGGQGYDHHR
ncbi:unnamed protein product [Cyprideis torosa]|uniref:Uncharacterized protein n=1 Tax=Cyprideis torosa TaxID=163714 RepID=A0A7R8W1L9_9CRUS|nr:unnamed protein product [Cyprideis torosa]CAG0881086.1 unnamed protein product [Cyprideis torosa]